MIKISHFFGALIFPFLISCAYSMHEVHVSDFSPYSPLEKGGEVIKAVGDQFVVLWFTFDTQYVNDAYEKLQNQCPGGEITSISSQLYTELGFFSWKNKLLLQGVCRQSATMTIQKELNQSDLANRFL